ncbi:DUF4374 domain-containing protein [Tenacibaculum finnmarkense]|uniref:DUF4374 domain-containing protein n=2 Tax=Tenacibaculum finnmarkense TaxID=2781243 RepID=UPI00187B32F0|nr:DUF4374 domain-containing protein [Tenacibaculum finnmarkense]MBE7692214.1 DUF4374 domain-containing protein [Tenacibaculum finnmarkense genomovar finnmarkense]MCG8805135.1 DUF4374 domain-containing protein [Tenacibaculum finnmarkense]MCG8855436.1 DUF4374 domain-containing protein [Tenacibaculum finnmarkense]
MKTNQFLKITIASLFLVSITTFISCSDEEGGKNEEQEVVNIPKNSKYTVSAVLTNNDKSSGYFVTTDNLLSGAISVVGKGYEGYANLAVSEGGFFYDLNDVEKTIDKYQYTDAGLIKIDAISYNVLPDVTIRYIKSTGTGDLLISTNPAGGEVPYMIINLENFTLKSHGTIILPKYNGYPASWASSLVKDNTIYFGVAYNNPGKSIANELVTVKYDYPSFTNEKIITSDKSIGSTAGYRGNGSFLTENGDIYQFNLNSFQWQGIKDSADKNPAVFVKITNGEYDDNYVLDVSAKYDEPISIWNAWYAGDNIVYASIIKESDLKTWRDLSTNVAKLVEINLSTGSVTELNIPSSPLVNVFNVECVDDGKFYIPINISGGNANIYEITIGGGANGFQTGAVLDGSNVFVNAIYNNF